MLSSAISDTCGGQAPAEYKLWLQHHSSVAVPASCPTSRPSAVTKVCAQNLPTVSRCMDPTSAAARVNAKGGDGLTALTPPKMQYGCTLMP